MLKKVAADSDATALASIVFPFPGGPYNSKPVTQGFNNWGHHLINSKYKNQTPKEELRNAVYILPSKPLAQATT